MEPILALKAVADETRMKILELLLKRNCCVRALARTLGLSEATVSQHLKVLREAGLIYGEKRGYFMHYDVRREALRELARGIEALAKIERESCAPQRGGRCAHTKARCRAAGSGVQEDEND